MSATDALKVEVPDIGDFDDVPVIEILVSEGDEVALDDPLLTLESDKATMDVPAPFAGVVREIEVKVGDRVRQGTVLLTMEPADGGGGRASKASSVASNGAPNEASAPDAINSALEAEHPEAPEQPEAPVAHEPTTNGGGPVYASPSVRRLARELGVDLREVKGSGRKGRIIRSDVEQSADSGPSTPGTPRTPAPASPAGPGVGLDLAPWPSIDFSKFGDVERTERSRIQRISAPNLARNWVMIPHVTHNDEADITELEAWRKQLNSEQSDVKVTMVAFLIKASVA
ncbi:MAG TPA: biotin/lipoyl-containing protein, partial [Solirubrobacteraceae bacterium]